MPCTPMLLLDSDRCNQAITICSGPYPTYEAAVAACASLPPPPPPPPPPPGPINPNCCGPESGSTTITATVTFFHAYLDPVVHTITLTREFVGEDEWTGSVGVGGSAPVHLTVTCADGVYSYSLSRAIPDSSILYDSGVLITADPLYRYTGVMGVDPYHIEVTHPCPEVEE